MRVAKRVHGSDVRDARRRGLPRKSQIDGVKEVLRKKGLGIVTGPVVPILLWPVAVLWLGTLSRSHLTNGRGWVVSLWWELRCEKPSSCLCP